MMEVFYPSLMSLEKITKQALLKLVHGQTFEDDKAMKKHLIHELRILLILTDPDRVTDDEVEAEGGTYNALHILDKESMHDVLIAVIFSTKDFPDNVVDNFESHWVEEGAQYGVMLTPTECRLFDIRNEDLDNKVVEIEAIPPLKEVDYEDEKGLGGRKYWYQLMNHKVIVFGFLLFVLLLFGLKASAAVLCRINGQVKTDVTQKGAFYYLPGDQGYDRVVTGDVKGERRYCSESEAVKIGWQHVVK